MSVCAAGKSSALAMLFAVLFAVCQVVAELAPQEGLVLPAAVSGAQGTLIGKHS